MQSRRSNHPEKETARDGVRYGSFAQIVNATLSDSSE
jgi:hypothetical protein